MVKMWEPRDLEGGYEDEEPMLSLSWQNFSYAGRTAGGAMGKDIQHSNEIYRQKRRKER